MLWCPRSFLHQPNTDYSWDDLQLLFDKMFFKVVTSVNNSKFATARFRERIAGQASVFIPQSSALRFSSWVINSFCFVLMSQDLISPEFFNNIIFLKDRISIPLYPLLKCRKFSYSGFVTFLFIISYKKQKWNLILNLFKHLWNSIWNAFYLSFEVIINCSTIIYKKKKISIVFDKQLSRGHCINVFLFCLSLENFSKLLLLLICAILYLSYCKSVFILLDKLLNSFIVRLNFYDCVIFYLCSVFDKKFGSSFILLEIGFFRVY